jgi:hypothetical protein
MLIVQIPTSLRSQKPRYIGSYKIWGDKKIASIIRSYFLKFIL